MLFRSWVPAVLALVAGEAAAAATPFSVTPRAEPGSGAPPAAPAAIPPEIQPQEPKYSSTYPGSKRVKIRYGPYIMPDKESKNMIYLLEGEKGVLVSGAFKMKKPCQECVLLVMEAGLEYANGTNAAIDSGAWLHHIMMMRFGNGAIDAVCPQPGERFFASGNERSELFMTDISAKSFKSGYHLTPESSLASEYELMNLNAFKLPVYITITYEYMDGPPQAGWLNTRPVYLDVTGCFKASETRPPKGKDQFTLDMAPWVAPKTGTLVSVMGHLHDGGSTLQVLQNGNMICDSVAAYGQTPKYIERAPDGKLGMSHISSNHGCIKMGEVKSGDKFTLKAVYDMKKYMPMRNAKGQLSTVMGIGLLYYAVNGTAPATP